MGFLDKKDEKKTKNYLVIAFWALVIVVIVKWLWPDVIPFSLFQFWKLDCSVLDLIKLSWPMFAWGTGVSFIVALIKRNNRKTNRHVERILVGGFLVSLFAGVTEEVSFRWLIFYSGIVGYKILNWLIFGWAGFGVFQWFQLSIAAPISNFLTLGYLQPILFGSCGWAVGAALLTSNGKFRDGHAYQGIFGLINSWFIGMFMFYLMLTYGLIASIIVHFLYDLLIFIFIYINAVIERMQGNC